MKNLLVISFLIVTCSFASAQTSDAMIGRWEVEQALKKGQDITPDFNPQDEKWMELHADENYLRGGQPEQDDKGIWSYDSESQTITLISDSGEESETWKVVFDESQMTWKGQGNRRQSMWQITFVKADLAP